MEQKDIKKVEEVLLNPTKWPEFPFLSLKRLVEDPKKKRPSEEFGTIAAVGGKVYLEVLVAPLVTVRRIQSIEDKAKRQENILNLRYEAYKTIEEMVEDGWEI